jgi:hypothetical protein
MEDEDANHRGRLHESLTGGTVRGIESKPHRQLTVRSRITQIIKPVSIVW